MDEKIKNKHKNNIIILIIIEIINIITLINNQII